MFERQRPGPLHPRRHVAFVTVTYASVLAETSGEPTSHMESLYHRFHGFEVTDRQEAEIAILPDG